MDDIDLGATIKGFAAGQKLFGRYKLTRILGRGGMGVVWLARDDKLERDIALKFLPEVVKSDRAAMEDLKRETRRALELTHPHIVRIYDFVDDATMAGIAMEYVAGDTLSNRRLDQPAKVLEPGELRRWLKQLCEALAYAHERARIVHRDLKPANLMLDAQGDLKVADFGISRSISDSVSRVSAQAGSSGTPAYMSPQQMMGEKPEVADDIYALGATLYELLTGKPPFFSGNLIAQVQSKVPASITERRRELEISGAPVPPEWESAIAACLAKEPAQRPASARELAQRLGLAVSHDTAAPFAPPSAPAKPATHLAPKTPAPAKDHAVGSTRAAKKTPLYAALAAVVLLLAGLGWYFGAYAPEQQRLAAEQARQQEITRQAEQKRLAEQVRQAELQRIANLRLPGKITTDPAGAEVRVDDDISGLSPMARSDFKPGSHTVHVRLEGYEVLVEKITVAEKSANEWGYKLVRSTGAMALTVLPAGPAKFQILAVGKGGSEVMAEGNLPAEVKLPTGRYEFRAERSGWSPAFTRMVEVKRGESVALTADLRGGIFTVKSTPAGATVYRGVVPIGQTPLTVDDIGFNQPLPLEVRLEGFQSEKKDISIPDADHPQTWEVVMREIPKLDLHPDFTQGPSRISLTVESQTRTTARTTTNGQTTTHEPTSTNNKWTGVYELAEPDGFGSWSHAQSRLSGGNAYFQAGTLVDFLRIGNAWHGSVMQGGYTDSKLNAEDLDLAPSYPALMLDADILPPGPAETGRNWDVPVSAHRLLLRGLRFAAPTGSIRARVTKLDSHAADPWAEVEYTFDLSGETDQRAPAGYTMQQQVRATGTLIMRLMLAAKYVSTARLRQHQAYQTTLTPLSDTPESSQNTFQSGEAPLTKDQAIDLKRRKEAASKEAMAKKKAGVFALRVAPKPATPNSAAQMVNTEVDSELTITAAPLTGAASLQNRPPPPAAPQPTRLVFFRKKVIYVGSATFTLKIDGAAAGKLANGSYWVKQLPPGVHAVAASLLGMEAGGRQVELLEGTTTYLEWSPAAMSAEWRAVTESEALGAIGVLKLDSTSPAKLDLPEGTQSVIRKK